MKSRQEDFVQETEGIITLKEEKSQESKIVLTTKQKKKFMLQAQKETIR